MSHYTMQRGLLRLWTKRLRTSYYGAQSGLTHRAIPIGLRQHSSWGKHGEKAHSLPVVREDGRLEPEPSMSAPSSSSSWSEAQQREPIVHYEPMPLSHEETQQQRGKRTGASIFKLLALLTILGGCLVTAFNILNTWVQRLINTQTVCKQVAVKTIKVGLQELQQVDQCIIAYANGLMGPNALKVVERPSEQDVEKSEEVFHVYDDRNKKLVVDVRLERILDRSQLPDDPALQQLIRVRDLRVLEIIEGQKLQAKLMENEPDTTLLWCDPREWKKVRKNTQKTRQMANRIQETEKERNRRMRNVARMLDIELEWGQSTSQQLRAHLKSLDYPLERHAQYRRRQSS